MRIIFLGPPGAGKGTQAERLAHEQGLAHISTGAIFRQAVRDRTELGQEVERYLNSGRLVPDALTIAIVRDRLTKPDCQPGFVLDGFPRTEAQAEALDATLTELAMPLTAVINLTVPDEVVTSRLSGRRFCPQCGATYHVEHQPPKVAGLCDECGTALIQRSDDREETVRERLRVYHEQTTPLIGYYRRRGLLKDVAGEGSPDQVAAAIREALTGRR